MHAKNFVCFKCKSKFPIKPVIFYCKKCGYSLDVEYDYNEIKAAVKREEFKSAPVRHWKYWPFYPVTELSKVVSLQEGGTPLIKSQSIKDCWFKFEACNPTGSFKDRGSSVEISKAKELKVKEVLCASTGNMGASIAAYSARAGIKAKIFVPSFVQKMKLRQILAFGASIKVIKGNYDKALNETKKERRKSNVYLTGDYPFRGEGQKSVAFEIIDQMQWQIPDNIVCPVGNGTLIYATFKACKELKEVGLTGRIPKIFGIQAKGCNPVVKAWKQDSDEITPQEKTNTLASAIDCGNPVDGLEALHAIRNSKGRAEEVSDKEMIKAMKELAMEGLYAELSGAVALAGAKKLELKGKTVCIVSGSGLKEDKKMF